MYRVLQRYQAFKAEIHARLSYYFIKLRLADPSLDRFAEALPEAFLSAQSLPSDLPSEKSLGIQGLEIAALLQNIKLFKSIAANFSPRAVLDAAALGADITYIEKLEKKHAIYANNTTLRNAIKGKNVALVKSLLSSTRQFDLSKKTVDGTLQSDAFELAAWESPYPHPEMVLYLVDKSQEQFKFNNNVRYGKLKTLLDEAALKGHEDLLDGIIAAGIRPDENTLYWGSINGQLLMVQKLVTQQDCSPSDDIFSAVLNNSNLMLKHDEPKKSDYLKILELIVAKRGNLLDDRTKIAKAVKYMAKNEHLEIPEDLQWLIDSDLPLPSTDLAQRDETPRASPSLRR
jgi:hypothetical protein